MPKFEGINEHIEEFILHKGTMNECLMLEIVYQLKEINNNLKMLNGKLADLDIILTLNKKGDKIA